MIKDRKTNKEILEEIKYCDNPVTLASLKSVAVNRLGDCEKENEQLKEAIHKFRAWTLDNHLVPTELVAELDSILFKEES